MNLGNYAYKSTATLSPPESVIRWRMDTSEVMDQLELVLLGKTKNGSNIHNSPDSRPMCNAEGVVYIRQFITPLVNKVTLQGNTSDEAIYDTMKIVADTIIEAVGKNYRKWEIDDSMRSTFVRTIHLAVYLALTRSIHDLERQHAVGSSKETVNTTQTLASPEQVMPNIGGYMQR